MKIGLGFDVHPFEEADAGDKNQNARKLILGGMEFPDMPPLKGHSDADVLAHACTDAILGAAGLGDMGDHFPDTDPALSGANSIQMLSEAAKKVRAAGFEISNLDCIVITEQPKIAAHRNDIQKNLSYAVGAQVTIGGKRPEGLGSLGRQEGIACMAVALLQNSR